MAEEPARIARRVDFGGNFLDGNPVAPLFEERRSIDEDEFEAKGLYLIQHCVRFFKVLENARKENRIGSLLPEAFVEIIVEFQVLVLEFAFSAFRENLLLNDAPSHLLQMRQERSVLVIGAPKGAAEIDKVQTILFLRCDP